MNFNHGNLYHGSTSGNTEKKNADVNCENDENDELSLFEKPSGQRRLEKLLVSEMNGLSIKDRELVYEEIHGVSDIIEETPDFVQTKLEKIEGEIEKIQRKDAYDQAKAQNSEYVKDPKFLLMFLRAEYFDTAKAAIRMTKFFEGKLRYFGAGSLTRSLTIAQDFDQDDLECLKSGHEQWLSSRDRSGRVVFVDVQSLFPRVYKSAKNMMKTFIYLMLAAMEDEENQKRGIVAILYHVENVNVPDPQLLRKGPKINDWLPVRFIAVHVCVGSPLFSLLSRMILAGGGSEFRIRSRTHCGTHQECQYSLMTFGLPMDVFPITVNGELKKSIMADWVTKRAAKETAMMNGDFLERIDVPARSDILVGKGKPFQQHHGNVLLRELVELRLDEYTSAGKAGGKTLVANEIVKQCGRFLKKDSSGWWIPVDQTVAREKVLKLFMSAQKSKRNRTRSTTEEKNCLLKWSNPSHLQQLERTDKRSRLSVPPSSNGCFRFSETNDTKE